VNSNVSQLPLLSKHAAQPSTSSEVASKKRSHLFRTRLGVSPSLLLVLSACRFSNARAVSQLLSACAGLAGSRAPWHRAHVHLRNIPLPIQCPATVLANPSLHLTGYSGLRPLPPAGELQR